jgi:hypothetical protein
VTQPQPPQWQHYPSAGAYPPPRRRTGLIVGIVIGGCLVGVGGLIVGLVLGVSRSATGPPVSAGHNTHATMGVGLLVAGDGVNIGPSSAMTCEARASVDDTVDEPPVAWRG